MASLVVWIATLVVLLIVCNIFSKKVLLTPQFCYVGCFLPQALFAITLATKWNINLSVETTLVLIIGTTLFVAASIFFNWLLSRRKGNKETPVLVSNKQDEICIPLKQNIESWKLIVFLLFQIVASIIFIAYGINSQPGATVLEKLRYINDINKFGNIEDKITFPIWVSWPRTISSSSTYLIGYFLLRGIVFKDKKNRVLLVFNLLIGFFSTFLSGGRIQAVSVIIALIIQAYFIWGSAVNWEKRIPLRAVLIVTAVCSFVLLAFQWTAQFIGRGSSSSIIEYLGVYVAAPLRNLDTFVRQRNYGNSISNWETLLTAVNNIGELFGIDKWVHQHDLPFIYENGQNFGNVYTCYYDYLHDGGYFALVGFVLLEAFLMQALLHRVLKNAHKNKTNVSLVVYSYLMAGVVLSFFMNRFYSIAFSRTMIYTLICWCLLSWFFTEMRISKYIQLIKSKRKTD